MLTIPPVAREFKVFLRQIEVVVSLYNKNISDNFNVEPGSLVCISVGHQKIRSRMRAALMTYEDD